MCEINLLTISWPLIDVFMEGAKSVKKKARKILGNLFFHHPDIVPMSFLTVSVSLTSVIESHGYRLSIFIVSYEGVKDG